MPRTVETEVVKNYITNETIEKDDTKPEFSHVLLHFTKLPTELSFLNDFPIQLDKFNKRRRNKLWKQWDFNGSGKIGLNEVETSLASMPGQGKDISSAKPVTLVAFRWARDSGKRKGGDSGMVDRHEFRQLLIYLVSSYCLYYAFNSLDELVEKDGRISLAEFKKGLHLFEQWGLHIPPEKAEAAFAQLDNQKSCDHALYDEFCSWATAVVSLKSLAGIDDNDDMKEWKFDRKEGAVAIQKAHRNKKGRLGAGLRVNLSPMMAVPPPDA